MAAEDLSPRVASPQDRDDVVAILVSAFSDDPTWSWAFPDPSLRAAQHGRLWGLFVEGAMRHPWVWLTPGNTATSVWIPPNGTDLSEEQEAALEPTIVEMLGADASPVMDAFELQRLLQPAGLIRRSRPWALPLGSWIGASSRPPSLTSMGCSHRPPTCTCGPGARCSRHTSSSTTLHPRTPTPTTSPTSTANRGTTAYGRRLPHGGSSSRKATRPTSRALRLCAVWATPRTPCSTACCETKAS